MGKAIKTFTPSNTLLIDQQKQDYVPIFLPSGAIGRRRITEIESTTAAALRNHPPRDQRLPIREAHENIPAPYYGTHTFQEALCPRTVRTARGTR